jgi:L-histidine Nalpha-methyltransferase
MMNTFSEPKWVIAKDSFLKDVLEGLTSKPKTLPSKYFYNDHGDKLFHYIMNQPEYYLTCAEHEILNTYRSKIQSKINVQSHLRIIEPGAGDGFKTKILLEAFLNRPFELIYNPIDISANVLDILCDSMVKDYPQLLCEPTAADYFHLKNKIPADGNRKLMLFLGSNLGNFNEGESLMLLQKFSEVLETGDYFLLGVDLVKDPNRILAAYNDANGVTAEFNYNLLHRINAELDGNFLIKNFQHYPVYNPLFQQAESYLVSKVAHDVYIDGNKIHFDAWETILTEISRKYTPAKIEELAYRSGFTIVENYYDMQKDFCCSLWKNSGSLFQ